MPNMPYDDPSLSEFSGYLEAKEPGRRERAEAWATAIGLQKVDGLLPSDRLLAIARRHIEGDISADKARSLVDRYYETKEGCRLPDDVREADKVSARIIEIINDQSFLFDPSYLQEIHAQIFDDVFPFAGAYRRVNIRKHEWVLKDDSVTYGPWRSIAENLRSAFDREQEYSYAGKSTTEMIAHFSRFISRVWQIHPFREGNTRTTAVFAIKYLRALNIPAANDLFAENSWFFRNALVRANYDHPLKGVARDFEPLERFFRNLMLGEKNELKSRYLRIEQSSTQRAELSQGRLSNPKDCRKKVVRKWLSEKVVRKGCQKTSDKLLVLLREQPHLTQVGMGAALGISRQAVQKHITALKAAKRLSRIGPDKGGVWKVERG